MLNITALSYVSKIKTKILLFSCKTFETASLIQNRALLLNGCNTSAACLIHFDSKSISFIGSHCFHILFTTAT